MNDRGEGPSLGGRLFVLSGPSGVGKDALLSRMRSVGRPYHFTVTVTTRPIRAGERDGVDYIFISPDKFRSMIEDDDLLEWAEVHGNLYGVPKSQVTRALERGQHVFLKIDVQGAATVKKLYPSSVLIFLEPPDLVTLDRRLTERGTESSEALRIRQQTARLEMKDAEWFDYRVVNHDEMIDVAARAVDDIVGRETAARGDRRATE